jgi:hypothetical protein
MAKLQSDAGPNSDQILELEKQRDALLQRVETLERAVRDPEFYAEVVDNPRAYGEVVTTKIGNRTQVTSDSERARDAYEDWGSAMKRTSLRVDDEVIEEDVQQRLNRKGLERLLEVRQR